MPLPPVASVAWQRTFRIIPSRYPPIDLFERVADPADWDHLNDLETLTNSRVRNAWGEIALVPLGRRVAGPGASWVMAPFTHLNPKGSRFSDGTYGVYYAANSQEGAIRETVHHMGKFYAETADPPHREDMRVLVGSVDAPLHDIRGDANWDACHDAGSYTASQSLGRLLRDSDSNGIAYRSVRHTGGENIAVFWPNVVTIPIQGAHLQYEWNGERIERYFDMTSDAWIAL